MQYRHFYLLGVRIAIKVFAFQSLKSVYHIPHGSDFSLTKKERNSNALIRLNTLIRVCKDIGIKVCVGTQSAEYALFKRVYPNQDHNHIA